MPSIRQLFYCACIKTGHTHALHAKILSMELFSGAPENMDGREEREIRSYAFLDQLDIAYQRTDHPDMPATSMEVCAVVDRILDVRICKNLFLCNRQETEFWLLVMPGDKPFRTKELSKQLNISRLSFADEKYMLKWLDVHPGSVSVLGLINDTEHHVRLAVDEDVFKEEMFGCHPCVNTSSIRFRSSELKDKIFPALGIVPAIVKLKGE